MKKSNKHGPFKKSDLNGASLFIVAGPCVIESEKKCLDIAEKLSRLADTFHLTVIFKASYDKANRTSVSSFRGPGRDEGLRVLSKVSAATGLPICTDIHEPAQAGPVSEVADVLQIPAFLCRQTDLLTAAGATGAFVNIKKGQFMAPGDMRYAVEKAGKRCLLTERGTFFGYNRLVVDFTGIHTMKQTGVPVIFDATHSVQNPGGGEGRSTGTRALAVPLARAALCHNVNGLFFEVHTDPDSAFCDSANTISLNELERNLPRFLELHDMVAHW